MQDILKKLSPLEIFPKGWLKDQLKLQATGLSGNIGKYFDDLSHNNAWLGGKGEAWERGPYYLDGIIPLAYLLRDEKLISEVKLWIDAILASKNPKVGFGPIRSNDYWPRMVVQKALISYYRITKDKKIIDFLLEYYHFVYENIDNTPLLFWAKARALEGMEAMQIVYSETKEEFIIDLIEKLKNQSYDWWDYFQNFRYTDPMTNYTSRAIFKFGKSIGEPFNTLIRKSQRIPKTKSKSSIEKVNNNSMVKLISLTHGVNIAMAYKYPVTYGFMKNDKKMLDLGKIGYKNVMQYHGLGNYLHSSDEHLMGSDASGGVELCTVVEAAYSFEEMLRITKDNFYANKIEQLIFNSLPATFSQDMTAHQYVQQPNQISADRKHRQFFDTDKEANIFGIVPNYGCCGANMHQGFPKFAENLVYKDEKGLSFLVYAPCEINTEINGNQTKIKEITNYPFDDKIIFEIVEAKELTLTFRIPEFTKDFIFNGEKQQIPENNFSIVTKSGDNIEINFNNKLSIQENSDNSISITKNNLLLAMPLESEEKYVRGERPFHYREFVSNDKWNYSPIIKNNDIEIIEEKQKKVSNIPFDRKNFPLEYKIKAKEITNWKKSYNSAKSPPKNPIMGEEKIIMLVPYGSTNLRISQFAKIKE